MNSDLNLHFTDQAILKYLYSPHLDVIANIRRLFNYTKRIDIIMFEKLDDLRCYLGHKVPPWVVATNRNAQILVLDYEVWKARRYGNINQIIIHELVHVIIGNYKVKVPLWLNEGLAQYLAGQLGVVQVADLKIAIKDLYELNYQHRNFYGVSGEVILRLIAEYGLQTVVARIPKVNDYWEDDLFGVANLNYLINPTDVQTCKG